MGEALITRRGGSVKRGSITVGTPYKVSDPVLINAKNAVVYLSGAGYHDTTNSSTRSAIASIVIENGQLVRTTQVNEAQFLSNELDSITYNSASGEIVVTTPRFLIRDRSAKIPAYDYIIFD